MRHTTTMVTAGGLLAFALAVAPAGAFAQTPGQQLEELLVSGADTPAEHDALAAYYHDKAEEARSHATHHRNMGKRYAPYKGGDMRKHCDKLVNLNEQAAAEYDELAKGHEAEAKK